MAYNSSNTPKRLGSSLFTSAPSPWRKSCNPRRFLNLLNHCHDALKSSCDINSCSARVVFYLCKLANRCLKFLLVSLHIRAKCLQITSCFSQTFLIAALLTSYCHAMLCFYLEDLAESDYFQSL